MIAGDLIAILRQFGQSGFTFRRSGALSQQIVVIRGGYDRHE